MQKLIYLWKLFWWGLWELSLRFFLGLLVFCCFLGILVLVDVIWLDSPLPVPREISKAEYAKVIASPPITKDERGICDHLWRGLALLDKSVPEVSAWVRQQQQQDRIVFEPHSQRYIAAYNPFTRLLFVTSDLFDGGAAFQAQVLAHEFCHSRQSATARVKRALAGLFGKNTYQYIEGPAYEYGDRVYDAITRRVFQP